MSNASASRRHSFGALLAKGFCIGSADIVPGVSGGTMAFILGIYGELMDAIRSFDLSWLRAIRGRQWSEVLSRPHLGFLLPVAMGILAALLFFTRVIRVPELLRTHPEPVYAFFFGLIAGSIVVLLADLGRFSWRDLVTVAAGTLLGHLLFSLVPVQTPEAPWFLFLCGVAGVAAMLLPGISGSFVLLVLNKYAYVLDALAGFRLGVLLPFVLGIVIGAVIFSRILSALLHRHYRPTVMCIIGMLIASLPVLWPFQARSYEFIGGRQVLAHTAPVLPDLQSTALLLPACMLAAGFALVLVIHVIARRREERS